ncbi:terpene synthase family protein [Chitinophaga sp. 22321]|uniref:Uncharacterized protein n=1 Tax=Chitinophaga hostae TaxID=2831022 RepID=A0ABS5J982_9BACT|nr:hypothetical protein [Chitinophaga hostae]MBS0031771.1 hypothetical protein [Chitinophaga hostae]
MRQLVVRMMAWYNDIYSVKKDLLKNEAMNLVLVIRQEQHCTLEEAYAEAIRIHDADLNEFIKIKHSRPGFGAYNKDVDRFITNAELFLKGQVLWYTKGTQRYD